MDIFLANYVLILGKLQGLSQNNVDHCENKHETPSIGDVKYSVL